MRSPRTPESGTRWVKRVSVSWPYADHIFSSLDHLHACCYYHLNSSPHKLATRIVPLPNQIRIISNHYLSAISYEPRVTTVISAKSLAESTSFNEYEMEEDVTLDLAEFGLANAIYTALVEGHAAEISARRTAMENASNVS